MLYSICQQILKSQQWLQDLKRSVFIPLPKKGNAKECSNYHTIALISHSSKVMFKIFQARLQQYVNCELPDVQAGFRKGKGTRAEKEMGTHSSILAWKMPWTEEPGGLPSMGLHRVRHDWSDLAAPPAAAEEPEIKLPTSVGSLKKQDSSRKKHLLLLYWLHQSLWLCGSQ